MRCSTCNPRTCRANYLYVVRDTRDGAVKVGVTWKMSKRLATYQKQTGGSVAVVYVRIAGCEFSATDREFRAHARLDRSYTRRSGDWFIAPEDAAVEAVDHVCKGYSGAMWR